MNLSLTITKHSVHVDLFPGSIYLSWAYNHENMTFFFYFNVGQVLCQLSGGVGGEGSRVDMNLSLPFMPKIFNTPSRRQSPHKMTFSSASWILVWFYVHELRSEPVDQCTQGDAALPRRRQIRDGHIPVVLSLFLAPGEKPAGSDLWVYAGNQE